MRGRLLALLLIISCLSQAARADIVVVVHPESPLQQLSQQEVSDLYLGRIRSIQGSERLLVLDQPRDSELRSRFFLALNGMSLRSVNAYWARLQFSGVSQPPLPLPDSQAVIKLVHHNRLAIGYVEAPAVTGDVRPLLTLKE